MISGQLPTYEATMSEKRKPDLTLVMQPANGTKVRYEIFDGSQFIDRMQKA